MLRAISRGRLRERRQPAQVRRRRAAAVVRGRRATRARAAASAVLCAALLRDVGRIELPGAKVTLRMSQGVHSGASTSSSVGTSHLELLPVARRGAASSRWSTTRAPARSWSARRRPRRCRARCLGEAKGPGSLSCASRRATRTKVPLDARPDRRTRRWRAVCPRRSARMSLAAAAPPSIGRSRSRSSASTAPTR